MKSSLVRSIFILGASGLISLSTAMAQTSAGPGVVDPGHPRVNQVNRRETRQERRIANGEKTGRLTPRETTHLERGEQRLENNEKRDLAKNGGYLTKRDQQHLNREANRVSHRIYKKKHN